MPLWSYGTMVLWYFSTSKYMQKPKKTNKYTILILTILISGCYYNWSLSSLKENPNPAKQQTSEFDSTASDSELINNVELQHPFAGNQISQLTELEKLDSTAQLIEIAASSLAEEQFTTAGYWFALAKVMLSNVKRDEISEYIEYYQDLVIEINNFYMEYVAGIDVLPKESPPEGIMAGIDEAEGDTAHIITDLDEIDIDSLKIEIESLTKPEVAYDSTALEALLDTVKTLPPVPLVRNKKVNNAIKFFKVLPKRLGKFDLSVAPEKTGLIKFSRFHLSRRRRIIFLGFETFWAKDQKGMPRVMQRTARKKLQGACSRIKDWIKQNRHLKGIKFITALNRRLRGHYNYYSVVGNFRSLWKFYGWAVKCAFKWLNRRGGKRKSFTWKIFLKAIERLGIAKPKLPIATKRHRVFT